MKSLAKEHEARYGKARGQGWDGEWYAFRQATDDSDRSIRLLANRCRTGDRVRIIETRPLSRQKCWRVVEILDELD